MQREEQKEQERKSREDEGSAAAGAALAQPSQLHRQSGQPAHPLFGAVSTTTRVLLHPLATPPTPLTSPPSISHPRARSCAAVLLITSLSLQRPACLRLAVSVSRSCGATLTDAVGGLRLVAGCHGAGRHRSPRVEPRAGQDTLDGGALQRARSLAQWEFVSGRCIDLSQMSPCICAAPRSEYGPLDQQCLLTFLPQKGEN